MKKTWICLSLLAALALTACGGASSSSAQATPTPLPGMDEPATPPESGDAVDPGMDATPEESASVADEELSGMVDTLYAAYPVDLMMLTTSAVDLTNADWCQYHTGLDAELAANVDAAVAEILAQCYQKAVEVIRDNREDMDKVVAYLLEKETITGAEMVAILEGRDPALADQYADPEEKKQQAEDAQTVIPLSGAVETPEEPSDPSQPDQPSEDKTTEE